MVINSESINKKQFAKTKQMADLIGFDESWLKSNIGDLFFEGTHTHRWGYRTRVWDVPLVLNRIYNINNEEAHRIFIEQRIAYLNNVKCA